MALETQGAPATNVLDPLRGATRRAMSALRRLGDARPFRFASTSLLRRIMLANLVGLAVMIGGIYYLSHYQTWLVEAKKESLRTQGELIAAALASAACSRRRRRRRPRRAPK